MGLLNKVVSSSTADLDEMGKALRDRLLRLARHDTSPYTALSLLKSYGSFQVGLCLSLKQDAYESYAVVGLGLGVGVIRIDREKIEPPIGGVQKTALHPQDIQPKHIQPLDENLAIWAFPLTPPGPRQSILLMGVEREAKFNAHGVGMLLSQTTHVFLLPEADPPDLPLVETEAPGAGQETELVLPGLKPPPLEAEGADDDPENARRDAAVRQWIEDYAGRHPQFQGVLLDIPETLEPQEMADYFQRLSAMAVSFGAVFQLPSNYALILFSAALDGELIGHRLSKTLKTVPLVTFLTDNPDKAFTAIQPYLYYDRTA
jgi:hypothetical protein